MSVGGNKENESKVKGGSRLQTLGFLINETELQIWGRARHNRSHFSLWGLLVTCVVACFPQTSQGNRSLALLLPGEFYSCYKELKINR